MRYSSYKWKVYIALKSRLNKRVNLSYHITQVLITSLNNWDPGSIWAPQVGQDGPKTREKTQHIFAIKFYLLQRIVNNLL